MFIKRHIPNFLTCMNLLCGCMAIAFASNYLFFEAALLVAVATLFDFSDGFAARLLKAHSPIGKELDSLADMVSFGVAPAVILFNYIEQNAFAFQGEYGLWVALFSTFFLPVFSALRLAKFNIDTRQTFHFIGVPTPANALFVITFPFIMEHDYMGPVYERILLNQYGVPAFCIILAFLLVSPLPLISAKIRFGRLQKYPFHLLFFVFAVVMAILLNAAASPFIFISYIIFSLLHFYSGLTPNTGRIKKTKKKAV